MSSVERSGPAAGRGVGPGVTITGDDLAIEDVVAVARDGGPVEPLGGPVRERMEASRRWVREAVERGDEVIYGVNTGFGSLASTRIAPDETRLLSRNVILKCVVGVGADLPADLVRAMLLIRANSLAKGHSGVRPLVVDTLAGMLNRGVVPRVPGKGSLGASGDLAPLAHIAVVATRGPAADEEDYSGEAWYEGKLLTGAEAMRRAGLERPSVEAKEGLALTNGTAMMVAAAALGVHDAERILAHAEVAAALTMEGLRGLTRALHPRLHEANGQPGQVRTAARLRRLLHGSSLVDSDPDRIQDAYSVRCVPQVLGPVRDVLAFLRGRVQAALNAAADNPLILPDADGGLRAVSGGNFHGQGPALWLDMLGIALAEVASIAERRVFRLLTPELSAGLPAMLVASRGLNSGLMAIQYTAAALVSDNKTLAHPDSVDSLPTSANQEDHVAMGGNAARHALEIVANVRTVVAIELVTAAQAVDLRPDGPSRLGAGTAAAYRAVRERVAFLDRDRELTSDIEAVDALIRSGELLEAVDRATFEDAP